MKINKLIFSLIILVVISNFYKIYANNAKTFLNFKGSISSYADLKKIPHFRIIFNGKMVTNDENGFYSFPLEKDIKEFYFLVCKEIDKDFEKINTIKNLKLKDDAYQLFSFTKTGTDNVWTQKNERTNENFTVPDNCIAVLVNPKYIEKIVPWSISLNKNFVRLPKIILKSDLDENKLNREATKSLLRSLDLLPFHEKIITQSKLSPKNVKITITE